MRTILTILFLAFGHILFGQITFTKLSKNKNFHWLEDSLSQELTIYYQAASWTDNHLDSVRPRVLQHFDSVKSFVGISSYDKRVHLFIVDSREQMKKLIDRETNGSAFYKYNSLTGIAAEKINSIYVNHELFHVLAMNLWGKTEIWLNEGMAVYSDNNWHGYDLYQLTRYLILNNRYVSLNKLVRNFRKVDNLVSYPLMGSFVKYLDETYGRDTLIQIWKSKTKNIQKLTGKTIEQLEIDWLAKIKTIDFTDIKY